MRLALHDLWASITGAMAAWYETKLFIEHSLAIEHGTLHVIVGVLVWLVLALLIRRPVTSWRPWLWLLAIICFNEAVDLWVEQWPHPGEQYGEGAKDLMLTMILPTLLMVAARARPDLFRAAPARRKRR